MLFCDPMFVPAIGFKPTQFQGEISPHLGTDLFFAEIYKRTILISQCAGFFLEGALHVCFAMSVSIQDGGNDSKAGPVAQF